jgi:hypothetical protein
LLLLIFLLTIWGLADNIHSQNQVNEITDVSTASGSLKSSTIYDLIRLKIQNTYLYDVAVIYYYDDFSDGYGPEDSDKMFNSSEKIPEIFTLIDNSPMAINGFSSLEGKNYVSVPISVRNRVEDDCIISADLSDFTEEFDVVLEDKFKKRYVNLRITSYTYTPLELGIEHERFVLHLTRNSGAKVPTGILENSETEENNIQIYSADKTLKVKIDNFMGGETTALGKIDIYSLNGQVITSMPATAGLHQFELASGHIYIVRVALGNQLTMKKVAVR